LNPDDLPFEKEYFIHSKTSNYEDYRKRKFRDLALDLIEELQLTKRSKILDFGCATGGLLLEFKELGLQNLKGTDISYWAIDFGKTNYNLASELEYFNVNLLTEENDFVIMLDVLEHVPNISEIKHYLKITNSKNLIIRIPVSIIEGEPYFLEVSRNDATHVQCHTKEWWVELFKQYDFKITKRFNTKSIYDSEGVFAGVFQNVK
jgi:SAM-dependent methyltransferase